MQIDWSSKTVADPNKYKRQLTAPEIEAGAHRAYVGGMWEEIGRLQFDFLCKRGLRPMHTFLDIGCGALRGGVHFVKYLEAGNYYGVDLNPSILEAGRYELARAGLADKEAHLAATDSFALDQFGQKFDYALALSLFTHLFANTILRCVTAVREVLAPGGQFLATFFEAPRSVHLGPIAHHPGAIVTQYDRDPFHYSFEEMQIMAKLANLSVTLIGEWNHPRDQRMLVFTL
jgi:SAM-dependent methyltransferase